MIKRILIALVFLFITCIVILFFGHRVETYRDQYVVAGEIRTKVDFLAVHLSRPQFLTINGKTYKKIRGQKPFYIPIPQIKSVLFVTEKSNEHIQFHIVNIDTGKEIEIDGWPSSFGWDIGSEKGYGGDSEFVERVEADKMILVTLSSRWKQLITLNLEKRIVDRIETIKFDDNGNIIKRDFYSP